ncbi:DUF2007 domain-containing protein [Motilimonas sp. E26]|uniref:putative signal transducing protein n=1 Tax=Motilimonas sp. E26 TaxID=2865674 RepID=UPI001E52CE22|nr:DUF2007 domain-containing protein [Motilimonas sp. E26]MCE0555570.1 DUF2007 domain-containing protein [Motilimonas sp. E26]
MKLIYTHENRLLVNNVKNLLEQAGIETLLKNEFSQGGMGELAIFDCWPELWITQEGKLERAKQLVHDITHAKEQPSWFCRECDEENDASFETCWHCQYNRPISDAD